MIGQTVSHDIIVEKLGGGMGVVCKAEDTRLHRHAAIKVLHSEFVHEAPNGAILGPLSKIARIAQSHEYRGQTRA